MKVLNRSAPHLYLFMAGLQILHRRFRSRRQKLLLYPEVSLYNIGHNDSFLLYAHALNKSLAAGVNPRNGKQIVKRMWNRTFQGNGGPVFVNENGDRDTDFTLLYLDSITGKFRGVAQYLGWTHMFEIITDVPVHWPGRITAPPDKPKCGFKGELCVSFRYPSSHQEAAYQISASGQSSAVGTQKVSLPELLWMAPEHPRNYPPRQKSQAGDVYSFAIILYEICTRAEPYVSEIWDAKPSQNVLDVLLNRMEQYANNQVLPRTVANQLRIGNPVCPESFESVTIYFSDIIVDLLNDFYSCFDYIIEHYDVYKEFITMPCDVPTCIALKWGAFAAEMFYKHQPHVIIGPGCTHSVKPVSRMAVTWNVPHITYVGTDESLGDKKEFSMLSRLSYTMNEFSKFYIEVFNAFDWKDIANIYDKDNYLPELVGTSLQSILDDKVEHIKSTPIHFNAKAEDLNNELYQTMAKAASVSRVFVVSCHGDVLRKMVIMAKSMTFLPFGEYVFIFFFQFFGNPIIGTFEWYRGDSLDPVARLAYESVMVIRPRRPVSDEFFHFEEEVKERAFIEYNYTWKDKDEVSIFNIGYYDSFILYAHALNESLASGEDPRDGKKIVKQMWNRTFTGIGGPVFVNANGDRETDFTLLDLDPKTGHFRTVAQYLGWTQTFEILKDVPIHWPGRDTAPPNRPRCGFSGDDCPVISEGFLQSAVVGIITGVLFLAVMGVALFYYRYMRVDDETSTATQTAGSQTVGIYKGSQVHITKLATKTLVVDKPLLYELKKMREVTCANLTRLVGVCPDANNVCFLTEFCSRGSLQDILHNDTLQLDWDFKLSLINDIVEGMRYLHSSHISVHGRLTSAKCVIDSRFVLKITGYGLTSLNELTDENKLQQSFQLIWMAPEHLRSYPPRQSSPAGDVYSFAIILYEMCTRAEPYVSESWYKSLEDTLEKIRRGGMSVIRPTLTVDSLSSDIINLTTNCWNERPGERPTFENIRKVIKGIRLKRGTKPAQNVLDVLLNRMEVYANNLEGLVEERTQAFLLEKKRSEELLYQVLPRSIVDQLRCGNSICPESFESVTIYFSDVVGFTSLSAISTPFQENFVFFQVVDFLNDLYTCFDSIIDNYDVYKVETIGDAYMVVSGLPEQNGTEHVRQIARLALSILKSVRNFVIRHRPDTPLRVRIGIHSGPVCAGVVGRKMPRYCLFGDTVNTASRMESNGEPMKVHISDATATLLTTYKTFVMELRGDIAIKGKGVMRTFWLLDEIKR
ncbi:atrial natriuretic peptide receptor 1-like [Mya arenaria]|uniref:atrial natriuretic peptide receptor 1-like n=1 Tax=Mya arenaria TaxID=6604 RepID=UPI0022E300CC|nr:atrial natriuretic peptide receptor 1-like [Mya arenaria]